MRVSGRVMTFDEDIVHMRRTFRSLHAREHPVPAIINERCIEQFCDQVAYIPPAAICAELQRATRGITNDWGAAHWRGQPYGFEVVDGVLEQVFREPLVLDPLTA
jgi:hypothetical protein